MSKEIDAAHHKPHTHDVQHGHKAARPAASVKHNWGHDGSHLSGEHGASTRSERAPISHMLHSIHSMKPQPASKKRKATPQPSTAAGAQALSSSGESIGTSAARVSNASGGALGSLHDSIAGGLDSFMSATGGARKKVVGAIDKALPGDDTSLEKAGSAIAKQKGKLAAVGKLLGPAAVLAGGFGVYESAKQLAHGHLATGTFGLVGNGAGTGAGAAGTAKAFDLAKTADAAETLGKASGVLGGVAVAAGGGLTIYQGAKTGNKAKLAEGSADVVAGGLMVAGTAFPPLAVAGGLLYGGTLLVQYHKQIGHLLGVGAHDVASGVSTAAHAVGHGLSDAAHATGDFLNDINPF